MVKDDCDEWYFFTVTIVSNYYKHLKSYFYFRTYCSVKLNIVIFVFVPMINSVVGKGVLDKSSQNSTGLRMVRESRPP